MADPRNWRRMSAKDREALEQMAAETFAKAPSWSLVACSQCDMASAIVSENSSVTLPYVCSACTREHQDRFDSYVAALQAWEDHRASLLG